MPTGCGPLRPVSFRGAAAGAPWLVRGSQRALEPRSDGGDFGGHRTALGVRLLVELGLANGGLLQLSALEAKRSQSVLTRRGARFRTFRFGEAGGVAGRSLCRDPSSLEQVSPPSLPQRAERLDTAES